jgi:A/G-specific adenine glycosylase
MARRKNEYGPIVQNLLVWFRRHARDLPWRKTRDPYAVWVSEIMLQQTRVSVVIPYWERWMAALPDVEALARADEQRIHKLWEGLGYYTRVRNMQKAARFIRDNHGANFPTAYEDILALPGIGRYTAGAIASIAFHQPAPILDGNVTRVLARVFAISGDLRTASKRERLWGLAAALVEAALKSGARKETQGGCSARCSQLNQSLMELGATICTPRQPECGICPLRESCRALRTHRVALLPSPNRKTPVTRRRFVAFAILSKGRVLACRRPPGRVNAHLWELPNIEVDGGHDRPETVYHRLTGRIPDRLEPLGTVRHTITRFLIRLDGFRVTCPPKTPALAGFRWLTPADLRLLPFTSAHKRLLRMAGFET